MKISAIDRVETPTDFSISPVTIKQTSATLPACVQILVTALAITGLMVPAVLIAVQGATDPRSAAAFLDRPFSAVMLAVGLLLAVSLCAVPLRAALLRLNQRGVVSLVRDRIRVEDRGLIGRRRWEATLGEFTGVTHHIRATLSGARHEIILVHSDRSKDVLLNLSARAPEQGAEQFARLLGLNVVHASVLYSRRVRSAAAAGNRTQLRHAAA